MSKYVVIFNLSYLEAIFFLFIVFQDLLKHTPVNHADHAPLSEALAMTRNFLDEFNIIQTKSMFPVRKIHAICNIIFFSRIM